MKFINLGLNRTQTNLQNPKIYLLSGTYRLRNRTVSISC